MTPPAASAAERTAPIGRFAFPGRDPAWAAERAVIEAGLDRTMANRMRRWLQRRAFDAAVWQFGVALRLSGLYERGVRNALTLDLTEIELGFTGLPPAFDGYRILHLADLHIDALPGLAERVVALVDGVEVDLCVLTGDYRFRVGGGHEAILEPMRAVIEAVRARDGKVATLGNHDSVAMVRPFEAMGLNVLVNQILTLERGGDRLHVVGVDDVHTFRTRAAVQAIETVPEGFLLALVHSPEFVELAAEAGVSLYLTGHTHGGQVCLPGGWPIVTSSKAGRALAVGLWRRGEMLGYTSRGIGVSSLPVRFNCRGEATVITLRRQG